MLDWLILINAKLNAVVWGLPMIVVLIGVGLFITFRIKFIQISKFRTMWRETVGKIFHRGGHVDGDITPFQAVAVAMGGTVGVGNIAGVATAIALGGPGAIFWMFVSGVIGMATKFAEVVLGVHYRRRDSEGPMMGGAMMYITGGMGEKWKWLAVLFSLFGALAAFGIGNMVQSHEVAAGAEQFGIPRWISGLALVIAVGLVTIGGIQRIARVAMIFVPFMCGLYMLAGLTVIALNIARLPEIMLLILKGAFTPVAASSGFAGVGVMMAIRYGIARGVFSNEAGLGSAPMAHAAAKTDHPVRQGMWGMFEVFVDTIVVCMTTALAILLTDVWTSGESGSQLTMLAFSRTFGESLGFGIVVLSMILTAYDTNLAWCFYGETCSAFILGNGKIVRTVYRIIWLPLTLLGAIGEHKAIWNIADTLNGLMAFPNLIALVILSGVVVRQLKGFFSNEPYAQAADP
jgi:alanine or glycine:cation symporter, AGCS family